MNDSNIGLQRGKVALKPHQPDWHKVFATEKTHLRSILKSQPIEHVGSTAIAGLAAKPIIDIAVAVDSLTQVEACIRPLAGGFSSKVPKPGERSICTSACQMESSAP